MDYPLVSDQDLKDKCYSLWSNHYTAITNKRKEKSASELILGKLLEPVALDHGLLPEKLARGLVEAYQSSSGETCYGEHFVHTLWGWLFETTGRGIYDNGKNDYRLNKASHPFDVEADTWAAGKSSKKSTNKDSGDKMDENLTEASPQEQIVMYALGEGVSQRGTKRTFCGDAALALCSGDWDCGSKVKKYFHQFLSEHPEKQQAAKKSTDDLILAVIDELNKFVGADGLVDITKIKKQPKIVVPTWDTTKLPEAVLDTYKQFSGSEILPKEFLKAQVNSHLNLLSEQFSSLEKALDIYLKENAGTLFESKKGKGGGIRRLFSIQ